MADEAQMFIQNRETFERKQQLSRFIERGIKP
jgi:hypothetical protein